jgi:hypothetical protein
MWMKQCFKWLEVYYQVEVSTFIKPFSSSMAQNFINFYWVMLGLKFGRESALSNELMQARFD